MDNKTPSLADLLNEKDGLAENMVKALETAIHRLQHSSSFDLIQFLNVGALVTQDSSLSFLNDITISDLVKKGALTICMLDGIDPPGIEQLTNLLMNLVADDDVLITQEPVSDNSIEDQQTCCVTPKEASSRKIIEAPVVNSIEADRRLREAINDIKSTEYFAVMKNLPIADYWNSNWRRAPFLESLTFGQLAEIDVNLLLRKKSVTGEKIYWLKEAVDKCLAEIARNGSIREPQKTSREISSSSRTVSLTNSLSNDWDNSTGLTLDEKLLLSFCQSQLSLGAGAFFTEVLVKLSSRLSFKQFYELWTSVQQESGYELEACAQVKQVLKDSFLQIYSHLNSLLQGVCVSCKEFLCVHQNPDIDEEFQLIMLKVLLISLGAKPLSMGEIRFEDKWSSNSSVFAAIITAAKVEAEISKDRLLALLSGFTETEIDLLLENV